MHPLVAELKEQYLYTLGMYERVLEACTEGVWDKPFADIPFWREAYHTIFWLHTFLGTEDKLFHPEPFGRDIDPRLTTPPNATCACSEALRYAAETKGYVEEVFDQLTLPLLTEENHAWCGEFRTVYHRLLYGLRHGQHHIGRLTAYLDLEGVKVDTWQG
jgi:hypothetical protein